MKPETGLYFANKKVMAQKRINFESVVSFRLSYFEKEKLETLVRKLETNKSDFFRKQTQQFITNNQN